MAMSQEHGSSLQAVQQLMKKNQVRILAAVGSLQTSSPTLLCIILIFKSVIPQ